jgi:hypothetical protein
MDILPAMIRNRPGGLNTRGVATAKGLQMYGEFTQAVERSGSSRIGQFLGLRSRSVIR